ncbi:hypothetical protein EIK77_008269 [Talaromyces pinophilus]|nr:hypothetical protein EIK77_008269 [Talaromyces pinophilus]
MLNTKWETNLPGTGSATVNPLINQNGVYAGSNGYILRLDPGTGTVTAKNPLDGYGYHEVRLAAPVDGSLLVVGTYGYVLGLDPFSLSILWTTALPSSARQEVSVLCGPGGVYAGSNGYVYFLAPDAGTVMEINDLPGYGYHETRLGLITSDNYLLVGINGNTVCLDAYTLRTQWYNNMPGSGNDVTSVVGGMGVAYAACMGKVYRLNEKSGELLNGNNLSGTGSYEVRMALDSTTSRLYVGTNGYGICLNANTLATEYSASLPGCDYKVTNVTDVAVGDQKVAYFACNGYVYQLNPSGQVSGQNDLPGRDRGETRLATGHNGASELVVGIYGYAIGLNIANSPLPVDYSGKTYAVAWAPYIAVTAPISTICHRYTD